MSSSFIVGVAGKAGAGKDTVCEMIGQLFLGEVIIPLQRGPNAGKVIFVNHKFASILKATIAVKFGIPASKLEDPQFKNEIVPGVAPPKTWRQVLQKEGTEFGRDEYGEDFWIRAFDVHRENTESHWPDSFLLWTLSDCRFENEAAYCYDRGIVIRVVRPGQEVILHSSHASEAGFSDDLVTHEIVNDGSLEDLREKVHQIFTPLLRTIQRKYGV